MAGNRSERMGKEKILPLMFKLAAPSLVGMLMGSLYNIIDSIYLGHYSTEALSALSLAFPVQLFMIAIAGGLGVASSSLISRLLGMNKERRVKETTETVTLIMLVYIVLVTLAGIFFSENIITLFTDNPTLITMAGKYLGIAMMGSLGIFLPMVFNNFLRGHGDTITPMYTMLIGTIVNIVIDPILIFGYFFVPELGIAGAAYATVFARSLSAIFVTTKLLKRGYYIKLRLFRPAKDILKDLSNVGVPAMAMMVMGSLMLLGANRIVASYSLVGIAVLGIYARLQSFIIMPVMGISQAFQPMLGYNFGANNPERVKKTLWSGIGISLAFSMIGFIAFWFFPDILIRMFSNDPEVIEMGAVALKRISVAFPFMTLSMIISTAFQAIGKGIPSFFISVFRQLVLLLPIMYILASRYGLDFSWFAFPIAEGTAFILAGSWIAFTIGREIRKMNSVKA
ncbi:MAG: MATE family efflux transporter [Nanobdellota archaeon]